MSERERPIKEWNAVTYLRDFIQTALLLSPREQAIWEYLQNNRGKQGFYFYSKPNRADIPKRYRTCKRCGEIKTIDEFVGKNKICIECRLSEKRIYKSGA